MSDQLPPDMSADWALQLRALGAGFNLPQVQALYAPLLATQPTEGVQVHPDLRYGPHARHTLDVYAPSEPAAALRPVLVCVHGGGFIRGDKAAKANAGYCFARQGFVTVAPNYRLAPDSRWPSGPEDVVALVGWLATHLPRWGGDPQRIVLMGESAGAAHVAAAVLMRRFGLAAAGGQVRAAILASGPYNPRLERLARQAFGVDTPDPRNDAYFGSDDAAQLAGASIVEQIDAAPLPLLISYAERDLLQMQVQAGELFARLCTRHGYTPELLCVRDHNHFSQTVALNTGDARLAGPVADFVRRHA